MYVRFHGNSLNSACISYVAPPVVTLVNCGSQTAGENCTLTCQVTGGGIMPPTYRWFRDRLSLTSQTSATFTFSPLSEMDSGVYNCEATKSLSRVTSNNLRITVTGKRAMVLYCVLIFTQPQNCQLLLYPAVDLTRGRTTL